MAGKDTSTPGHGDDDGLGVLEAVSDPDGVDSGVCDDDGVSECAALLDADDVGVDVAVAERDADADDDPVPLDVGVGGATHVPLFCGVANAVLATCSALACVAL